MKRIIALFIALILFTVGSVAQKKVKYKDLILLLDAKQYDQAEPFLKKYLKDNNDNPNAYLFMGLIYQEKAASEDVLTQTELAISHSDSAILNYDIVNKTIDEKEVRRNDEYYKAYNRRDLRTGEFGVKFSDVKLDVEKRTQFVKERRENIKKLKEYFLASQKLYERSIERFKLIKANTPENLFYLLSDSTLVGKLKSLVNLSDSLISTFQNYKNTLKLIGKTNYNQVITLEEIKSFDTDGLTNADFLKDKLLLWDYKLWATKALQTIENEIIPLRSSLVKIDQSINQLGEKMKKDSVSVEDKLVSTIPVSLIGTIKKYDPDPIPLSIFHLKMQELTYGSKLIKNRTYRDSLNVYTQVALAKEELSSIKNLDSLASALQFKDLGKELAKYPDFVTNSYGEISVVKSLINGLKEYATHEMEAKKKLLERRQLAVNWLVKGNDSIPLTIEVKNKTFAMVLTQQDQFTIGLKFGADSLAMGYFYTVTNSRIPDISVAFPVDKINFKRNKLSLIKGLAATDGKGQIYFAVVYSSEKVKGKYPFTISKIYRSDGMAWSYNYFMDNLPIELSFIAESGELSIKTTSPTNEVKVINLDKNGKILVR